MGNAGHSVLKSLGQTLNVPRVVLRESQTEGVDPVARLSSPQMPTGNSDKDQDGKQFKLTGYWA